MVSSKPSYHKTKENASLATIVSDFEKNGYVILENFWPEDVLHEFERGINHLYYRQACKILPKFKNPTAYSTAKDFDVVMTALEKEDKEAAYQVLSMVERSLFGMKMATYGPLLSLGSALLGTSPTLLTMAGPHPFVNLPESKRLLYRWHSENCYYPKRRNFLNIWFPIFRNKNAKNGTMYFALGSHKLRDQQFIEYYGFDKQTEGKKNHFLQYEIPENELTSFKKMPVIVSRRDLVIFHRCMAHTSTINQSAIPSYAVVMRIFNYNADLTLSGDPAVQPYSGKAYGRPGLTAL